MSGVFYPENLSSDGWFAHYAAHFDTVEINNSFHQLPRARSRYGSHVKRLKNPRPILRRFVGRAERLQTSLGPILVQLPPTFRPQPKRLATFLAAAPRRHRGP